MPLFSSMRSKMRFDRTCSRMTRFPCFLDSVTAAAAALTAEYACQFVAELLSRIFLPFAARCLASFGASFDFGLGIRDGARSPLRRLSFGIRDLADGVLVLCDAYSSVDFILSNAAWGVWANFSLWPERHGRDEDGVGMAASGAARSASRSDCSFSFSCSADRLMNSMTRAFFGFPLRVKPSSLARTSK